MSTRPSLTMLFVVTTSACVAEPQEPSFPSTLHSEGYLHEPSSRQGVGQASAPVRTQGGGLTAAGAIGGAAAASAPDSDAKGAGPDAGGSSSRAPDGGIGSPCTGSWQCASGLSGKLQTACIQGVCKAVKFKPGDGFCVVAEECEDGNHCTFDACEANECSHGTEDCSDDNPCNTDGCSPQVGCTHGNDIRLGHPLCDDGNPETSDWCTLDKGPTPGQIGACWSYGATPGGTKTKDLFPLPPAQ